MHHPPTDVGVLYSQGFYFSHTWSEKERSLAFVKSFQSSTFIELLAVEYALSVFGHLITGLRVQFELDSETGHRGLSRGTGPLQDNAVTEYMDSFQL